ncbi:MAG: hypothetical protein ACODAC_04335 [Pseudomonadota bacterium]
MARVSKSALVETLLERYGTTVAEALRIPVAKNTPAALFQLLFTAMLLSARISADKAMEASRALMRAKLTTPRKMAAASWQERVDVITWHGYKRYDESASRMLGAMAERVLTVYGGDLRRLRTAAERKPEREKALLEEFKGIGNVGAGIFLREVQVAWEEVYPYADQRVLKAARRLGLGDDAQALARLVPREDFARFAGALLQVDLRHAYDEVASSRAQASV